jgi:alpha-ketoglutarate-dependent taurine dioxygenase
MIRSINLELPLLNDIGCVSREISAALALSKVVHFHGPPFTDTSLKIWEEIAAGVGGVMRNGEDSATGLPNGDSWIDVRYLPDKQYTFRHSCTAQPLHTDDAYKPAKESASYVLFLVEKSATDGGETYFVDAAELAAYIREKNPALFEKLLTLPVTFAKHIEGKTSPVLKTVDDEWEVTWNYYNVDASSSNDVLTLRDEFQTLLCSPETYRRLAYGFRLGTSEGVVWHDRKVLHGRTAFTASQPGERIIWKCNIY